MPPAQPWRNGRLERVHGSMEPESVREELSSTMDTALVGLTDWLNDDNGRRPHSAMRQRAPGELVPSEPLLPRCWEHMPCPQPGVVEAIRLVLEGVRVDTWGHQLRVPALLAGQGGGDSYRCAGLSGTASTRSPQWRDPRA